MNNVVQFWHIDSDTFLSDENLGRRVEDEWAAIPGRPVEYLTVDRLEPVVEVTKQLKELLYDEDNRKAVGLNGHRLHYYFHRALCDVKLHVHTTLPTIPTIS